MILFFKYFFFAKISWQSGFIYRFNFLMWRFRQVLQLATIYFLWLALTTEKAHIFSYSQSHILTYILGSSIIRSMVLSSRSVDAQGEIASGDLNNHLLKPFNYFIYWFSRDISDKLLNIVFSVFEVSIFIFLLRPPIFKQSDPKYLLAFIVIILLATILYFLFSFLISMTTFWYYQYSGWAQRFLSLVIIESLAGSLFPLDILPSSIASILKVLPPAYFIYMPMQIYLGRLSPIEMWSALAILVFWITSLYLLCRVVWQKGLKVYGAYGR